MSLQQARTIATFPDDIKKYLFSHDATILRYLLPEHREIIVDSFGEAGVPPDISDTPPMPAADRAALLVDILGALHAEADALRASLRTALTAQDEENLRRLIASNTYCGWHLAHVLAPFAREYAVELAEMGIDPQLVIAEAESKDKSRWMRYLREQQAPHPPPPAAALTPPPLPQMHQVRQPAVAPAADPPPVPVPLPPALPLSPPQSPVLPSAPQAAQPPAPKAPQPPSLAAHPPPLPPAAQAPPPLPVSAPAVPDAAPPPLPPTRARYAPEIIMDGRNCSAASLHSVLSNMKRDASNSSATPKLCHAYTRLLPISDAIEGAIWDDVGADAFSLPRGDVRNATTHRITGHPLASVFLLAHDNRVALAAILLRRPDVMLSDPAQHQRLTDDAAAAQASPSPPPSPPNATAPAYFAMPTAPATSPPAQPPPTSPPAGTTRPPGHSQRRQQPPGRPSTTPAPPSPRPAGGVFQGAIAAPLALAADCARWIKAHQNKWTGDRNTARALRQSVPVLATTRPTNSAGKALKYGLAPFVGILLLFTLFKVGDIVAKMVRQHTFDEYVEMGVDYLLGRPQLYDFVKSRDKIMVPVYLSAEQAREGNTSNAFQGLTLNHSQRYQVSDTQGDVLQVTILDRASRRLAVWVSTSFVIKVR